MARRSLAEYVQTLITRMEMTGTSVEIAQMADESWAMIRANKGSQSVLTNTGLNGKSASREVVYTADEQYEACTRALKMYLSDGDNDDTVTSTYADFSLLSR